jgi:hypothetical protein
MKLNRAGLRVGWVALCSQRYELPLAGLTRVNLPPIPAEYAALLYAVLHRLDRLGLDRIVVDLPPQTDEWLAIRDRLRRASTEWKMDEC